MTLHSSTFEYLKPTEEQIRQMAGLRAAAANYARAVDEFAPDGPDKTYVLRKIREIAMWVNVSVTRLPDGMPRNDPLSDHKDLLKGTRYDKSYADRFKGDTT